MIVQIDYNDLKKKIDEGWKKQKLAEHYNLNNFQMGKVLKECGLKIKRTPKQVFKIIGLPNKQTNEKDTQLSLGI